MINEILNKKSKILLGIYFLLILIIFIGPNADGMGGWLLLGTILLTFVTSIFVINNTKRLKNSLFSRIITGFLVNGILYSGIMLFYGLGNMGVGDKGASLYVTSFFVQLFLILSLILGTVLILFNKKRDIISKPNKILVLILLIFLIPLFYSSTISQTARLTENPHICFMHLEANIFENSFIFGRGRIDPCIRMVAFDTSNSEYCYLIKDTYVDLPNSIRNSCFLNIAGDLKDKTICEGITNDPGKRERCIEYISRDLGEPIIKEEPKFTDVQDLIEIETIPIEN
jgi:hypothetical protein